MDSDKDGFIEPYEFDTLIIVADSDGKKSGNYLDKCISYELYSNGVWILSFFFKPVGRI